MHVNFQVLVQILFAPFKVTIIYLVSRVRQQNQMAANVDFLISKLVRTNLICFFVFSNGCDLKQ